jgi:hypothetical protein
METTVRIPRLIGIGAGGAAAAAVVNAAIFGIGHAADVSYLVDGEAIELQHVVSFTLMSFAVGLVVAALVARFRPASLRALAVVGGIVGVVTMAMDFSVDSTAGAITLASMHLVTAAATCAACG